MQSTTRPEWDVIVIGSGIGGATTARQLALEGLKVLILEKGKKVPADIDQGEYITSGDRVDRGWWPVPFSQRKADGRCTRFFPAVGCAVGGSSIHYAAALERMAASDFGDLQLANGSTVTWPVAYSDFRPYYESAESLYRVKTKLDSDAMNRLSAWDKAMMEHLRSKSLHPDLLHVGMNYDADCTECIGRLCPRACKADAMSVCITEALQQRSCELLDNCEVQFIEADARSAKAVHAVHRGEKVTFTSRVVVLAAGGFASPTVLLKSASEAWPNGLANGSDQVGRNLMFHTSEVYAVWSPRRFDRRGRQKKAISIKDFYLHQDSRLGYIQSMGIEVGRGAISVYLKNMLRQIGVRHEFLLSALVKLPSYIVTAMLGNASLFAGMTEDDPNPDNRISLNADEPNCADFNYAIADDLRERAKALTREFKAAVKPWRVVSLSPTLAMNYGHPSGTCRFGNDIKTSVLDRNCKAHGLTNLFVVDSSFMPRSGAVNPSLTIAANALRVAPAIVECARAHPRNLHQ